MAMSGFILAAVGGAIGAAARHGAGLAAAQAFGAGFPWATLFVNIVGGFLMGVLAGVSSSLDVRVFLGVGILGGFTTFSAFSLETLQLLERGAIAAAAGYVCASVFLALGAAALGLYCARALA
jgi:CrcB protein